MDLNKILIYIICITPIYLAGQPMSEADLGNMLEIAEERVLNHDYYNAIEWYERCYELNKGWELAQNIGHMSMKLRDYNAAVKAYEEAISWDNTNLNPRLRFLLARALKMDGQYGLAKEAFEFFQTMNTDPELAHLAALELEGIKLAANSTKDPAVEISRLPDEINSRFSETSPFFMNNETILFSAFDSDLIFDYKNQKSKFTSNIYIYELGDTLTSPVRMAGIDKMPGWHQSNLTYSEDQTIKSITYAHLDGMMIDKTKVFIQEKKADGWSSPFEIEVLGEGLLAKHISIGKWKNKTTLFFSAELHSGKGGLDIYYAEYLGKGRIANPVNLIGPLNTLADEITPFFFNQAIYFSSDGHPSLGGLDIFVSRWDGLAWSTPYNLGATINSSADDFYYVTNQNQSNSLFVSNRPDGNSFRSPTCCDDIYKVSYVNNSPAVLADEVIPSDNTGIQINQPVLLSNIYFDYDSAELNKLSKVDLDVLYSLMIENPDWIVEIASHTDSRGPDQSNLSLSQRRADCARDYLIEKGINPQRLMAKGYGEQFILNQCKNRVKCTEEEHKYNRRAEFTVVEKRLVIDKIVKNAPVQYPKMIFDRSFIDYGTLKKGNKKTEIFYFMNNGEADLIIELASACECTELDYPTDPIPPGGRGKIVAIYDSKDKIGEQEVTIDILANTDPIIVEARFRVFVVE